MRLSTLAWLALAGCPSTSDGEGPTTEATEVCGNGIDDDGNGELDCADTQCACPEICDGGGGDEDRDGVADCLDSDCDGSCSEFDYCADGRDNDGDGRIDCDDTDCTVPECAEDCGDGRDNDADGAEDCSDTDCNVPECVELCADGRDNDADTAVDCDDPDCDGNCPEDCTDGRDNDLDFFVDCDDSNCEGACPEDCLDFVDNDADDLVDCEDPECFSACDEDVDGFLNGLHGGDDCNDQDPFVNPEGSEVCNGYDDNCDGLTDEADPTNDPNSLIAFHEDLDVDTFGRTNSPIIWACSQPDGTAVGDLDCDDANAAINPAATEICDGLDNDCDKLRDDADPSVDLSTASDWFTDADGDGFGDGASIVFACAPPANTADNDDDCDDTDPLKLGPGDWVPDLDADGYGAGDVFGVISCDPPADGWASEYLEDDCNDGDALIFPGAEEVCADGIDSDCDGVDGGCAPIYVGKFQILDGPSWTADPDTVSCVGACSQLFGGLPSDYTCSSIGPGVVDAQAFLDGWGDSTYCFSPKSEGYVKNSHYDCGAFACSYSTYVMDHSCSASNYCFLLP